MNSNNDENDEVKSTTATAVTDDNIDRFFIDGFPRYCPHCGLEVERDSTSCPHCKVQLQG